jgi:glycosyltransferase involved in cell wall biosynthesis
MDEFKSQCDKNNLQQYFTFAGKRSDIRQILPSCDIGFHASKGEVGYSLSILEYMSAGLVTIVPDRASTCNSIQHMETGLIYSHDDIGSACDMIELSLDTELAKQLSTNAIIEVHEKYDIDKTNKNLISILNNLFI